jgi:hypothetical protein
VSLLSVVELLAVGAAERPAASAAAQAICLIGHDLASKCRRSAVRVLVQIAPVLVAGM